MGLFGQKAVIGQSLFAHNIYIAFQDSNGMQKKEFVLLLLILGAVFALVPSFSFYKGSVAPFQRITGAQIGPPQEQVIEILEPSSQYEVLPPHQEQIFVLVRGLGNNNFDTGFGIKAHYSLGSVIWTPALVSSGPLSYLFPNDSTLSRVDSFFIDARNLPSGSYITIRIQQRNKNTGEIINGYRTFCIESCPQGFTQPGGGSSAPEPPSQVKGDVETTDPKAGLDTNLFTAAATAITGRIAQPVPCILTYAPGCGGYCEGDEDEVVCVAHSRVGRLPGVPEPPGCGCYERKNLPCEIGCHRDSPCPPAADGGVQVCSGSCTCIKPSPAHATYSYITPTYMHATRVPNRFPRPKPLPANVCGCDDIFIAAKEEITNSEWIKPMTMNYEGRGLVARYTGLPPPAGPVQIMSDYLWLGPLTDYVANIAGVAGRLLRSGTSLRYVPSYVAGQYRFKIFCHVDALTNDQRLCKSGQQVQSTLYSTKWDSSENRWVSQTMDLDTGNTGQTTENVPFPLLLPRGPNREIYGRYPVGGSNYAPDDYNAINHPFSVLVQSKAEIIRLASTLPESAQSEVRSAFREHGDSAAFFVLNDVPGPLTDVNDLVPSGSGRQPPVNVILVRALQSFRTRFWGNLGGMGCLFTIQTCYSLVRMPVPEAYGIAPAVIAPCGIIRIGGREFDFRPQLSDPICYPLDSQGRAYG